MKTLTNLLIVFLFTANGIYAQTGTIKGIIKDKETGEPIPGATVHIEIAGNMNGSATDGDGKFTIKPVNSGTYVVHASVIGYKKVDVKDVRITSDKITYVDVEMEIAATEIDVFTVVEVIHEVPLISKDEPHVQMLTAKDLKTNVNRNDPIKIATSLPGVTLGANGKDVYVRGSRPSSTQFITDGMKSITGDIGIPGQAIGSIKVYTGGVPARYGDLAGGVIVVETKSYYDLAQDYK